MCELQIQAGADPTALRRVVSETEGGPVALSWAQIEAERQRETRERYERARAWAREVTEQLFAQDSKFAKDFSEAEQQIFCLIKHP
jgi:hypothetical protein